MCKCQEPKRHKYCMYCGSSYAGEVVCGVCREGGIDGKLISGTGRRLCTIHKQEKMNTLENEMRALLAISPKKRTVYDRMRLTDASKEFHKLESILRKIEQ
jgi:hypothetical protein